jgi:hypothetical protein
MGRLPSTWGGKIIQERVPYDMPGEITIAASQTGLQYPDATFQNTQNKPFEIHRVIPRVYALDGTVLWFDPTAVQVPSPDFLASLVRVNIEDLGLNQKLTKAPTLIDTLTKGSSERTWEFADPHYLPNNAQLQVVLDCLAFPTGFDADIDGLRVCITLQGFMLVVGPPVA